jgi:hypothetical protein
MGAAGFTIVRIYRGLMVDRCSVRGEWRGEKKRGEIKERPAGRTRERAVCFRFFFFIGVT